MATDHLNSRQFPQPGDESAKAELYEQLRENFKKKDLQWLKDDRIRVDAPARIDPASIEYDEFSDWRASRQLKAVRKVAKKIVSGKDDKPTVVIQGPDGSRDLIDGHHHWLGYLDAKQKPRAFVIHTPEHHGPWHDLHDHQQNDNKKDDFGKTDKHDARD